jgi:hypothetical protein
MKKTVLLILTLMALGAASAQGNLKFGFNDSDFTYYGSEQGYLSLTYEDNRLIMHISDEPTDLWLRFNEIKTLRTLDDDGQGDKDHAEADARMDPEKRRNLARLARVDVAHNRAEIAHENTRMRVVMAAYQAELQKLGFELETNAARGAFRDLVFVHDSGQKLRAVFSRGFDRGDSFVKVRMTPA